LDILLKRGILRGKPRLFHEMPNREPPGPEPPIVANAGNGPGIGG